MIKETEELLNKIDLEIRHAEEVKKALNGINSQNIFRLTQDIDLAVLQVDKALRQLEVVQKRLVGRIQKLKLEQNMAYESESGPRKLETFDYMGKEYTVDWRLRQFRYMVYGKMPEFVEMDSEKGRKMLSIYHAIQEEKRQERINMPPEDLASRGR